MNIKKLILCVFLLAAKSSLAQTDSLDFKRNSNSSAIVSDQFKKNNDLIRVADAFAYTLLT